MKLPQLRICVLKIIQTNGLMKKFLKQSGLEIKKYQRFKRTRLNTDHVKFKQSRNQELDKKVTKELHKSKTY